MKLTIATLLLFIVFTNAEAQTCTSCTGNLFVLNGKLRADYDQYIMTATQMDDMAGNFGTSGMVSNHGGDLYFRGFWGVIIDKNGGNLGENGNYYNGATPAGGTFAVRTRTSTTAFRTDFIIRNNGNVGIGTTNPTSLLTVKGTAYAKEVKVDANAGADFVFNKDYSLPTLAEVESYVKSNKHLPGIASENEMKENGINLGEMNIQLLQKVEELTLYMIEIDKKMKALESENQMLKEKVKAPGK